MHQGFRGSCVSEWPEGDDRSVFGGFVRAFAENKHAFQGIFPSHSGAGNKLRGLHTSAAYSASAGGFFIGSEEKVPVRGWRRLGSWEPWRSGNAKIEGTQGWRVYAAIAIQFPRSRSTFDARDPLISSGSLIGHRAGFDSNLNFCRHFT